jgi:cation diffusion facilitator CzcD-associated flavoprotein CzcO
MANVEKVGVVIVGAGFSGLGMAVELKKAGIDDFVILEKAGDVGGVWRENTYPGCECDIRSHLYSFSFASKRNARWSKSFATQQEIWAYLRHIADDYGLRKHIRFGVQMTGERWDAEEQMWQVSTDAGDEYVSRFVVNSTRALFTPMIARLKGIRSFAGEIWHSAEWKHDYDLTGKRVAVIGTGASSIQIVPQIAGKVAELTVFQRTAPWILPKIDYATPRWAQRLFAAVPSVLRGFRSLLYWSRELTGVPLINRNRLALRRAERKARRHLAAQVPDPELRERLTPDYRIGCKRILLSNDYYPALTRDNVELVTSGVSKVLPYSIVDDDGVEREVDAIVFGTGFQGSLQKVKIIGAAGVSLWRTWVTQGAVALRGITVAGYPNMFFLHGPNSGVAHTSMVFMIEAQTRFVRRAISLVTERGMGAIDTRPEAQQRFQDETKRKHGETIWTNGGCTSWYLDDKGENRTMWPGPSWRYWLKTRQVDEREFELIPRATGKMDACRNSSSPETTRPTAC